MIVNHPNYVGLPIERKNDGSYSWIATAKSDIGRRRIQWCEQKALELGMPLQPGVYADVMLAIHPTKEKVCQTCGRSMSLFYHYPNANFLKAINQQFHSYFTMNDHIRDIWNALLDNGISEDMIARFFITKGSLPISSEKMDQKNIIDALEYASRKGDKKCLGPGAMSNFPDRFDGFHTYNRCCRAKQDMGRSRENLRTYGKDRRAYEYWSDGNIHAADEFMHSTFFDGVSADHVGPISLGFVHDSHYLCAMSSSDNSTKRDRLQVHDIDTIFKIEKSTKVYPMSWYAKEIWEHIKANYKRNPEMVSVKYRDALKQNMANFMFVVGEIINNCPKFGVKFLVDAFLRKNLEGFKYTYSFDCEGNIIGTAPRHFTGRNANEFERYQKIAINSVKEYNDKNNRHLSQNLTDDEKRLLNNACQLVENDAFYAAKELLEKLMSNIQRRIICSLSC